MDLAIDLIYELVMYGKSLSAGPCEVSSLDLAIEKPRSYAAADNIYL